MEKLAKPDELLQNKWDCYGRIVIPFNTLYSKSRSVSKKIKNKIKKKNPQILEHCDIKMLLSFVISKIAVTTFNRINNARM